MDLSPAHSPASPYLTWAISRPAVTYDLAPSDIPPCVPADFALPEVGAPMVNYATGWPPLLETIAARYGVPASSIALAPGTSGSNALVMTTLLRPGDHVIVEHPAYDPLYLVPETLGATVTFVARRPETRFALDVEAIRAALTPATKLIVISNLYNPVGVRADDTALREIARIAEAHGTHVLVDEVYLEWLRDDPSLQGTSHAVHTAATFSPKMVTTTSLTKAFGMSALHLGWALAEPALAKRFRDTALLFGVKCAHLSERLVKRTLEQAATLIVPMREKLVHHRALVADWVEVTPGVSWCEPDAGATALVHVGRGDTHAFVDGLIRDYDTAVVPGGFFGAPEYIRIGLGVPTERLTVGLERIRAALG